MHHAPVFGIAMNKVSRVVMTSVARSFAVLLASACLVSVNAATGSSTVSLDNAYLELSLPTISKAELLRSIDNFAKEQRSTEQRVNSAIANCRPGLASIGVQQTAQPSRTQPATVPSGRFAGLSGMELAKLVMKGDQEAMAELQKLRDSGALIQQQAPAPAPAPAMDCAEKVEKDNPEGRYAIDQGEATKAAQMLGTVNRDTHTKIVAVNFDSGLAAGRVNIVDAPPGGTFTDTENTGRTVPVLKIADALKFLSHPGSYPFWFAKQPILQATTPTLNEPEPATAPAVADEPAPPKKNGVIRARQSMIGYRNGVPVNHDFLTPTSAESVAVSAEPWPTVSSYTMEQYSPDKLITKHPNAYQFATQFATTGGVVDVTTKNVALNAAQKRVFEKETYRFMTLHEKELSMALRDTISFDNLRESEKLQVEGAVLLIYRVNNASAIDIVNFIKAHPSLKTRQYVWTTTYDQNDPNYVNDPYRIMNPIGKGANAFTAGKTVTGTLGEFLASPVQEKGFYEGERVSTRHVIYDTAMSNEALKYIDDSLVGAPTLNGNIH
jgi:hypothetical protein